MVSRTARACAGAALAVLALAVPAAAQRVEARFEPGRVALGETAELVVEVSAGKLRIDVEEPDLPDLGSFEVLGTSRSSEVRLVGTDVTRRTVFRYTLRPRSAGTLRVDPIHVRVAGEDRATGPVRLLVLDAGDLRRAPEVAGEGGPPAIFAVTRVDRPRAWTGAQLTLTFAFYHDPRVPLGESPDYDPPDTPGFWRVELDDQPAVAVERIGGRTYHVQRFRYALFPLHEGTLTIGPATVRVLEPDPDRWWLPGRPRTIRTEPLSILAEPLPDGAPAGFAGAVGRYRLSGSMDRRRAPAGTPVELEIVVEGTGNPTAVPPPDLPDWPDVAVAAPTVESSTRVEGSTVEGTTTFRFLLTPREAGSLDLGAARLAFFDPAGETYGVDSLRLGEIVVDPGPAVASAGERAQTGPTLWEARDPTAPGPRGWAGAPWYWVALAGPWLAWLAAIGAVRARASARRAPDAAKTARERLTEARRGLADGRPGAAAEAVEAIGDWLEARWGVRPGAVEPASARAALAGAGVPEGLAALAVEARARAAAVAYGGGDAIAAREAVERLERRAGSPGRRSGRGGTFALALAATAALAVAPSARAQEPGARTPAAAAEPADLQARWREANRAYREGDLARAADAYAALAARRADPRLEADRAAALWRGGEEGAAVAAYLRSLELDPRAFRVRADLAALRAGLGDPPTVAGRLEETLGWVRLDEWLALLLLVSWGAFAAVLAARRWPAARPLATGGVAAVALVAAIAALDAATVPGPRAVAAEDLPIAARPGGPAIATLPEGSVAAVLEADGAARRVRAPGLPAGWVASDRIVPLD